MSLKQYLLLMSAGTLLCWVSWVFVIFKISPGSAGFTGIVAFYFSLFLSVVGTFSVLGFWVRRMVLKDDEAVFRHVRNTFRQSLFIAIFIVIMLALSAKNWLFWWNSLMLLLFFAFIESLFTTGAAPQKKLTDR